MYITKRIREEHGTVVHFCKTYGFNINTFRSVIKGFQRGKKITDKLIELGYMVESDIPTHKNVYDRNKKTSNEKVA